MFDEAFIEKLKQKNISVDSEKTMQRTEEIWKDASSSDKRSIEKLAGVARSTIYRVYNTGSISIKLVMAIALTIGVNPEFITGQVDERTECTDEMLKEFLIKKDYKWLLDEMKNGASPRKNRKRTKDVQTVAANVSQKESDETCSYNDDCAESQQTAAESVNEPATPEPVLEISAEMQEFADKMTEEEMVMLMRGILFRASAGIENAVVQASKLKMLLLS